MELLEARNIVKHFGGVPALSDGNLICRKGKITGLLGANGSGKSTISKIITGVYLADSGEIFYKGEPVHFKLPMAAKQAGIAMAFQNLSLLPDLKVWQNIILNFEEKKGIFLNDDNAREKSQAILDQFLPGFDIERTVSQLDSGEKQIVEIAKALIREPELLILDEPTAALERAQVNALFSYIRRLAEKGIGIIFTSHRMGEVMEICDDVVVFRNGRNVGEIDFEKEKKDSDKIVYLITGESKSVSQREVKNSNSDDTNLKIENLNLGRRLKNVSLGVRKGEILGIGGLQGQGQNELMLALAGRYSSLGMKCELGGESVRMNSPAAAIHSGIVLVPGDRLSEGLITQFSVYENMILPKQSLKKSPFFLPTKQYRGQCEEIIKSLSIKTPNVDLTVDKLSGGNQQKVVVGKWLPFDINVLLLADPAKGVDVGAKHDMYEYIHKMVAETNISVILYASDNDELVNHCDRVLIMYEGSIVKELSGDDISEEAIVDASLHREEEVSKAQ